ncbi:MAG TPA: DUF6178 family protein [Vicinamibacterales bacterium]
MSHTNRRASAPHHEDRLARVLDSPLLERVVPHLAPETLHHLIRYRGLDACGDLVASATPSQLRSVLDLDLWRNTRPGRDEQFDAGRFGEWLEVLIDTGESVAARAVASLDTHLVIAGLSRYLRVFDPGTFEPTEQTDDEAADRHEKMNSETSANVPECEVGGYLVRARRTDAWDAIVTLLVTLDIEQHDYFHAVMRGCRRLSNSTPEVDGLDDLLLAPEQHLHDVGLARGKRQSRLGYVSPADARAFLQLARQPHSRALANHPIAASYFRDMEEDADDATETTEAAPTGAPQDEDVSATVKAVVELLGEVGIVPAPPRALIGTGNAEEGTAKRTVLARLIEFVLEHDQRAYLARSRELAFLANTLLAGCSVQSRAFTHREASEAAACICNLGLECWPEIAVPIPDAFLADHDLVAAFEAGWSVLYRDVSLFVADGLVSVIDDLTAVDAGTRRDLRALQRTLVKNREAGTPWRVRDTADVLATLDAAAWISVTGLLDECPIMPAALTAILERRTSPIDPAAFEFISTAAQIGDIRLFMRALPSVLSR